MDKINTILVVLPNWLGDAVMATPAIELLAKKYNDAKFTFVGSYVSIEALKYHPQCDRYFLDDTKKSKSRLFATYKLAKKIGKHDLAITFRSQFHSSLLLALSFSKVKIARDNFFANLFLDKGIAPVKGIHLVEQYAQIVSPFLDKEYKTPDLKLYIEKDKTKEKLLGINPGATYGSAKRWYPHEFAKVAYAFKDEYKVVIFGGPSEIEMADEVEKELVSLGVSNFENLAGKTDIKSLCSKIASLSLFVTNDSGPMHIAAAYKVPSIAIFGPTNFSETSQWKNPKSKIVTHNLDCAPCMKRECPLKVDNHKCMKDIKANEVIEAIKELKL